MQAPGRGVGGGEGRRRDQSGSRVQDDRIGAASQVAVGPAGATGPARASAGAVFPVAQIPYVPGPGGQNVVVINLPIRQLHELSFNVLFPSPVEAEVAQRAFAAFQQYPDVERALSVNGSLLNVRWVAQDRGRLHTVVTSFLEDFTLIFQIIQTLGPSDPGTSE
ncbi:PREDICTED: EKC/KEOPS complex subunit LAGE3-like [Chinchilla lanigera]|uniref:EKC/KEOPS complex subunit LAGE3-like n=1 Tax=Chinchilla lanigera TaxID=34839 RepID=UPI000695C690|nr:PREDICTED: EKC/KEOPS complex subunit LAGE3-like [Chinchilla lanigera]